MVLTLSAQNIEVSYDQTNVLKGISFEAQPGAITAIVGPNGSGKSTLVSAITGIQTYRGKVQIDGVDISTMKPWELAARRAVLPQRCGVAFPFTVIEVVRIGLSAGTAGDQMQVPMQALAQVGMEAYAARNFQDLSGGEAQRVMLARVLAQVWSPVENGQARWLLLDEPVASLDIAHQLQVMDVARSFADSGGGVVAVMHDLNLTALYADQVMVITGGKCLAAGPSKEVFTDSTLSQAYGCTLRVSAPPSTGLPYILPHAASI